MEAGMRGSVGLGVGLGVTKLGLCMAVGVETICSNFIALLLLVFALFLFLLFFALLLLCVLIRVVSNGKVKCVSSINVRF